MTAEPLLTILVTTYNRASVLDVLLDMLSSYQEKGLAFNILVSDDCSSDSTRDVCNKWEKRLNGFSFIRTECNLGMDNNFMTAYEHFDTPYCWLLGDTRHISYEGLKNVIEVLEEHTYDALILRCRDEMPQERIVYSDINTLLAVQGWHITNNASCIIPKKFIQAILYHRYLGTTFLHMGIFIENLCLMEQFKVLYMGDVYIKELNVPTFNKVGWNKHPFLNFGKLWYTFIMSLPNQIDIEIKEKVIYNHNEHTHILDLRKMPASKVVYGQTFIDNYKTCRRYVPLVSHSPVWVYDMIILHTPTAILRVLHGWYKRFLNTNK